MSSPAPPTTKARSKIWGTLKSGANESPADVYSNPWLDSVSNGTSVGEPGFVVSFVPPARNQGGRSGQGFSFGERDVPVSSAGKTSSNGSKIFPAVFEGATSAAGSASAAKPSTSPFPSATASLRSTSFLGPAGLSTVTGPKPGMPSSFGPGSADPAPKPVATSTPSVSSVTVGVVPGSSMVSLDVVQSIVSQAINNLRAELADQLGRRIKTMYDGIVEDFVDIDTLNATMARMDKDFETYISQQENNLDDLRKKFDNLSQSDACLQTEVEGINVRISRLEEEAVLKEPFDKVVGGLDERMRKSRESLNELVNSVIPGVQGVVVSLDQAIKKTKKDVETLRSEFRCLVSKVDGASGGGGATVSSASEVSVSAIVSAPPPSAAAAAGGGGGTGSPASEGPVSAIVSESLGPAAAAAGGGGGTGSPASEGPVSAIVSESLGPAAAASEGPVSAIVSGSLALAAGAGGGGGGTGSPASEGPVSAIGSEPPTPAEAAGGGGGGTGSHASEGPVSAIGSESLAPAAGAGGGVEMTMPWYERVYPHQFGRLCKWLKGVHDNVCSGEITVDEVKEQVMRLADPNLKAVAVPLPLNFDPTNPVDVTSFVPAAGETLDERIEYINSQIYKKKMRKEFFTKNWELVVTAVLMFEKDPVVEEILNGLRA